MALDERSHMRVVAPREQVAFPMAWNGTVLDFGRTFKLYSVFTLLGPRTAASATGCYRDRIVKDTNDGALRFAERNAVLDSCRYPACLAALSGTDAMFAQSGARCSIIRPDAWPNHREDLMR